MANIRKRSENSYVFSVDLGFDAKGKRLRRYKTHRISDKALLKTRKKLKDHLESEYHKFKAEVLSEEYIKPEKMLFSKFVVDWENKFAVKKLSETTLNKQLNHLQTHILPVIGHQQIDKIKKIHLIDLLDKTKRVDGLPLKSSTKEDIYKVLKSVFDRAVEWKVLKTTPVTGVPKPKIDDVEESSVYDEEESSVYDEEESSVYDERRI
ncbi:N-terminal phage integrase SAM-like domain-containing protein [Cytobacillus horneckiae]|uniref:N-terminal phage integrase SAM-like domain-containing protein n=1 Tax=Cytobacillus horneckiae TaxID=549687 RepID=UPI000AA6BBE5|nr:N-terminal phage integrase SAM-like domain-containing protein [Cytobacillus horneckiae]MEC1155667.1 N-terminal phage integrase SAM-like domain-containing protein [Cytobacillus horneckiae]MED2940412.1 N-terminal phage integrase SAM-like domain-containing protein [Cytobacillus horneckiae]